MMNPISKLRPYFGTLRYRARIHHIKLLHHQLARGLLGLNFLGVVAKFHAARHAGK